MTTDKTDADRLAALNALADIIAWAEVGLQSAPRGKTIPDLNWCGKVIRSFLTTTETQPEGI